ncbi:MAG: porphobilinogen synthase [Vampirovibrionales bacterium]|nr:porphobilinogen synthase [Vampirovibrionales bacterium]
MTFPMTRLRRRRKTPVLRELLAETHLRASDFVYPLFISDRGDARLPVEAMPGVYQLSIDNALIEIGQALEYGVKAFLLFGLPEEKDQEATAAWDDHGIIQRAIRRIKKQFGDDVILMADTCVCEYMTHGHCGIVMEGRVLNDPSAELIARVAVSQVAAGADVVAPSAMMDGQALFIREALDEAGLDDALVMGYSAKFASSLYGPFREAAESAPVFGDRKTYQMDARNAREALEEITLDVMEGADIVMIKPALGYLDLIYQAGEMVSTPIAAYCVSGEYSMIKAAAQNGWIDEEAVTLELLGGVKRAGADLIITYHAVDAARWLMRDAMP